jgi:hypothetical protein
VRGPDGATLGYAVLWRDESDAYRNQEVFQRLRTQAEDLPVPVMFPDPTQERWFGNAACENALERLAPHLPHPVSALDGVPISIFFPDEARRRKLFGDPDLLPHKEQVQIGPETVAILVTPVRDQEQHYLGPQVTWEIIHFTRPVEPVSHAAEPAAVASPLLPAAGNEASSLGPSLRLQARALETATHELQTVIRLLDTAADELEGESPVPAAHGKVALPEAIRLAQTAAAALMAVRQTQPSPARHDELSRAVATITTIARRTNQLALDAALLSVHEDVNHAAEGLHQGSRVFAEGLAERVRSLSSQAQASADALRQAKATAARLAQLRIEFDIDPDPA